MMELNIHERVRLLGILPKEGNFITLRIVRDLQTDLSFKEEDIKKYKLVQTGDQVNWDGAADAKEQKDIKMGGEATALVVKALKDMDKDNKLTPQHMSLYEKFIEVK